MSQQRIILEAHNLELHRGGVRTLSIAHLSVIHGEVLALVGPNGSGKSTLLLTLACLLTPTRGDILLQGHAINHRSSALTYRRNIAMVFQEPLLLHTSVFNNVAVGLKMRGIPAPHIKQAVEEALCRFHIAALADRSARTLSGGEAQRVSLARAFVLKPQIVFLDEPFSSLDPPTREALIHDLEKVIAETKTTVVFATHNQEEALRLADRMAVMHHGTIVQIGTTEEVINNPHNEFVASFVGMETVVHGIVQEADHGIVIIAVAKHLIAAVGEAQPGEELLIGVRPENVTLSTTVHPADSSARNVFPATVARIVPKGLFYKVSLDCGFPLAAYVTGRSLETLGIREGVSVTASFKATAVHIIRKRY